jgi:catecholate siderophore receptor
MSKSSRLPATIGRLLGGTSLSLLSSVPALAEQVIAANQQQPTENVLITGQRPEDYRATIPRLPKLTEPLIDTPQSIDVITEQVLKDRAVTNLNDALKSVPGISIGAGEFSWQGNNPSIRGFVARNDMFLDGIRDYGSYYRDPFYLQSIEVLQGPSSILFGRGSTGGVINQTTKTPELERFIRGTMVGGSDMTRRGTLDMNMPLEEELGAGAAFRINLMGHAQSVEGRNAAKQSRFGLAPSLALGIGTPTRLTLSYYNLTAHDVPDYGLPWFGTSVAPVPRQNFYGFDSDFLNTGTNVGTFRAEHDFFPMFIVRNTIRYAHYTRDLRITEPIISQPTSTPLNAVDVSFNIFSGNSTETMLWDQFDTVSHFDTGPLNHALVAGIEGGKETSTPFFANSSGVPTQPLLSPDPHRLFNAANTFPRFDASANGVSVGIYAIDTVKLGESWEMNAGIRWDSFNVHYKTTSFSTATPGLVTGQDDIERTDQRPSYRGAIVYKPETNGSVYFSYGTSFNPSTESLNLIVNARSFPLSNRDLAPEENETFEVGTKWDVVNGMLSVSAAVFRLEKTNARVPDPLNSGFNILEGAQRVDGLDLGLQGRITENWQIMAGYTYLDSQITKTSTAANAAPLGAPLVQTPKNSLSFFTEYRIAKNFEIGAGGAHVSSRYATNTLPSKIVPGYWTFDVMAKYDFTERMSLQLNVNNVLDKYYYEGLHNFHVVPGAGRTALLTLNFNF